MKFSQNIKLLRVKIEDIMGLCIESPRNKSPKKKSEFKVPKYLTPQEINPESIMSPRNKSQLKKYFFLFFSKY